MMATGDATWTSLDGSLGVGGIPLGRAFVDYNVGKNNTLSFGGHFGSVNAYTPSSSDAADAT